MVTSHHNHFSITHSQSLTTFIHHLDSAENSILELSWLSDPLFSYVSPYFHNYTIISDLPLLHILKLLLTPLWVCHKSTIFKGPLFAQVNVMILLLPWRPRGTTSAFSIGCAHSSGSSGETEPWTGVLTVMDHTTSLYAIEGNQHLGHVKSSLNPTPGLSISHLRPHSGIGMFRICYFLSPQPGELIQLNVEWRFPRSS